jgi:hypothetical protein
VNAAPLHKKTPASAALLARQGNHGILAGGE